MSSELRQWIEVIERLGALGLLFYLAVRGLPLAGRALALLITQVSDADRLNRQEVRASFLDALGKLEERHDRVEQRHAEAVRELARAVEELARGLRQGPPRRDRGS